MQVTIYVDGSFNEQRQCYGGGFVIIVPGIDTPITGNAVGNDAVLIKSRNIAGELLATRKAMEIIMRLAGVTDVLIYHDYTGIAYWVTGEWAAKKPVSREYRDFMLECQKRVNLQFQHVKGHSGDYYNNMADKLARDGTFLPLGGA